MQRTTIDQSKLKKKAPADGSRRYKKGIFPAYDREYSRLAGSSMILRDTSRYDYKNAFAGSGIGECQASLLQLVGNKNGKYKEGSTWYSALIPAAKDTLKEVYKDFKRWQGEQINKGLALEKPTEWPEKLLQERLKAEARLDVRRKEKALLERKIKELKEQLGKAKKDVPLLPDGPVGRVSERPIGKYKKKTLLDSVDGQKISFSESGIPYINEPDSPYHQMPVATYRQMSKAWKEENKIRDMDLVRRNNAFKEKAKEEGFELRPMFTRKKFKALIKGEINLGQDAPDFEPWPDNPEWPEDAKKITELKT